MNKFSVTRIRGDKNGEAVIKDVPQDSTVTVLMLAPVEYKPDMMEALANGYSNMTTGLSYTPKEYGSTITEDGYEIEFVHLLKALGNAVSYLHNVQSAKDKKLHEFDKNELHNRFLKIIKHLK